MALSGNGGGTFGRIRGLFGQMAKPFREIEPRSLGKTMVYTSPLVNFYWGAFKWALEHPASPLKKLTRRASLRVWPFTTNKNSNKNIILHTQKFHRYTTQNHSMWLPARPSMPNIGTRNGTRHHASLSSIYLFLFFLHSCKASHNPFNPHENMESGRLTGCLSLSDHKNIIEVNLKTNCLPPRICGESGRVSLCMHGNFLGFNLPRIGLTLLQMTNLHESRRSGTDWLRLQR